MMDDKTYPHLHWKKKPGVNAPPYVHQTRCKKHPFSQPKSCAKNGACADDRSLRLRAYPQQTYANRASWPQGASRIHTKNPQQYATLFILWSFGFITSLRIPNPATKQGSLRQCETPFRAAILAKSKAGSAIADSPQTSSSASKTKERGGWEPNQHPGIQECPRLLIVVAVP